MRLESPISPASADFKANREHHARLASDLEARLAAAREGGGAKAAEYQKKQGKMLARERVQNLLDPGTSLLELSPLAGHELYKDQAPAGGMVTGVGQVAGRTCLIIANDQTVKGGTYYPITVKKHVRAQEIAQD